MNASTILYDKRIRTNVHNLPNGKVLAVKLRYDDDCKNGHNSFSITGDLWSSRRGYEANQRDKNNELAFERGGCIHDEIMQYRGKQYGHLIRWHLVRDDGLMHYVENTLYHLGYKTGPDSWYAVDHVPNIDYARSSACWPDMPESFVCDPDKRMLKLTRMEAAVPVKAALEARLPALMGEFHRDMATIEWHTIKERVAITKR